MDDFLSDPRTARFYRDVPQEQLEPFRQFRAEHQFKRIPRTGVNWDYYDVGSGPETRLLLTGALGVPFFDWHHLQYFAQHARVLEPSYPPVKTMDALCDGIAGILRHEGLERVHVQGGSYGGFVAQVFVRRYPEMVETLVLSHTQPSYPDDDGLRRMERLLGWMRWMPAIVLRQAMRISLNRLMPKDGEVNALLMAIYNELLQRLTKDDVIGIIARTVDYEKHRFTPEDLASWPGRILIMMTENDRTTPQEVRDDFERLYPQARIHLFQGTGHTTSWDQADEYRRVIDDFVRA